MSGEGNAYHDYSSEGGDDTSPVKKGNHQHDGGSSSTSHNPNPHRSDSENSTEGLLKRSSRATEHTGGSASGSSGKESNSRGSKKKKQPPRTPSMVRLSALHNGGLGTAGDVLLSGKSWRELDDENKAPSVLDTAFQFPSRLLQVRRLFKYIYIYIYMSIYIYIYIYIYKDPHTNTRLHTHACMHAC